MKYSGFGSANVTQFSDSMIILLWSKELSMGYLIKLNGWQRLWIAVSIFMLIPTLLIGWNQGNPSLESYFLIVSVWATIMALLYVLGLTIKWVIKGFRDEK